MKLNLGCHVHYKKDWINLDDNKLFKADVYHNLNKYPYPFKDNEFDYILASHILEHLNEPERFLRELQRILKKSGIINVVVPHFTNAISYDPTHESYFGYKSIHHIIGDLSVVKKVIDFTSSYKWLKRFANAFPNLYENSPLRIFPAKELIITLSNMKILKRLDAIKKLTKKNQKFHKDIDIDNFLKREKQSIFLVLQDVREIYNSEYENREEFVGAFKKLVKQSERFR